MRETSARRHNIEVRQLIAANPSIRSEDDMIDPQQQIVLPPPAQEAYPTATAYSVQPQAQPQPQVRRETPGDVAAKYNVDIGDLMRANPTLRGPYEPIPAGAQIVLPPARKRESARDVARRHNIEVRQLIAANPSIRSEDDMIDPQQQIVLPPPCARSVPDCDCLLRSATSSAPAAGAPRDPRRRCRKVQRRHR